MFRPQGVNFARSKFAMGLHGQGQRAQVRFEGRNGIGLLPAFYRSFNLLLADNLLIRIGEWTEGERLQG